eukprot:NODE_4273_length_690_cov_357.296063.p2 GENE.NODE_4273_length_690_cov_357.296063~~NODE_4273_length_690_cov_357.296063.p2  ORF type:complete len:130 (+),score=46.56 NODE_4273_length_690_cov_357.296063:102-491(+)
MSLRTLVVLSALAATTATGRLATERLDINQKVFIESQAVLGAGAGQGALGKCRFFAPQHVSNPAAPEVQVCGTSIKATFFLRGRCKGYYHHSKQVGQCNTGLASTTCDSWGPSQDRRFGAYQSYIIENC